MLYRVNERILINSTKNIYLKKGLFDALDDVGPGYIDVLMDMGAVSLARDFLLSSAFTSPKHTVRPRGYEVGKQRYQKGKLQGPPKWWERIGQLQFQFLIDHDLQKDHRLLDVGCGTFRAGRLLIDHLDDGRYYGIEKWQEALDIGIEKVLEPQGLMSKHPHLAQVDLTDAPYPLRVEFCETRFDIIWAHCMFVHLGPRAIAALLKSAAEVLADDGVLYATSFVSEKLKVRWGEKGHITTYIDQQFWHYSADLLRYVAREAGLVVSATMDYAHPYQMKMLEIRHKGAT